jgi:hypothetical protein
MVDEFRSLKESLLKSVFSAASNDNGDANGRSLFALREVISTLASLAGKGKDEIVQMISREIGNAVAAALKEPMRQAMKDKKLRMTIEFVPQESSKNDHKKTKSHAKHFKKKK